MAGLDDLRSRIDAEFVAAEQKIKEFRAQKVQEWQQREERLQRFEKLLEEMTSLWRPRLEALAQRFGERVNVEPDVTPSRRQATLAFQSNVARIQLRFAAFPDQEVRQVFFTYDLEIIPILIKFDSHDQIAFPLESIDRTALGAWLDDRILSFVRTYLQVHQDQHYQKEQLVEDPIAGVRFPRYAAAATMEWKGKPVYFISEDTRKEFERQQAAAKG